MLRFMGLQRVGHDLATELKVVEYMMSKAVLAMSAEF